MNTQPVASVEPEGSSLKRRFGGSSPPCEGGYVYEGVGCVVGEPLVNEDVGVVAGGLVE